MEVFKGFLSRALHVCSEKYLAQEMKFLTIVFVESGHSITVSEKIAKEYINSVTPINEKENIGKIKTNKIVKLP